MPHVRIVHVVVVVALGWLGWASTTDGGVSARIDDLVSRGRSAVQGATEDPSIKQASQALNARFERSGSYPVVTEALLREDPELTWGVGVETYWCSSRSMVLTGLTGHGTVSRLLVDGHVVGDVDGQQSCPTDLVNPEPWKY